MELMADYQPVRAAHRAQASHDELVERLALAVRQDGTVEPLEGLMLRRASAPTVLGHGVSYPAFCVIAQGRKEIWLGNTPYQYDPAHYLIVTAELPFISRILEASRERPYLGLVLRLAPTLVGSVMIEAGHPAPRRSATVKAFDVSPLDAELLDAVVRLVRLLDAPTDACFLAPLVMREIVYRLLMSEQGARLRHMVSLGGPAHCIARAIERLRKEFDRPLRIADLARELGMSVSSFHHHFKELTGMSPLQFQKHLRLQAARQLMLGEGLDAATAGSRVGYNDAAHFSRDYKRLFGVPPRRDVERLRRSTVAHAGL